MPRLACQDALFWRALDAGQAAGGPCGSVCRIAFDAFYYAHCCGRPYVRDEAWLRFFGGIADRIVADVAPQRVLDAGCALGFLVEMLRDRGVDAYGVDVSEYAIEHVEDRIKPFCRCGSLVDDLGGEYDLIVSIEVAEHMPVREAEAAIANICAHTTDVLFSSSPLDQREPTHVNVQPPEYWAEQFARHGFYRDVDYDATYILPWAARFQKRDQPVHRLVRDYERRYWALLNAADSARAYSQDLHREFEAVEAERDTLRAGQSEVVNQLRETIANMERSQFWKLRLLWLQFKNLWS